jgi:3-hydroxybutyrate dehydrogenase
MLMEVSRPAPITGKQLAGRIAVVTGSTSGIGLGIARAFAKAGASVVLNGLGKIDDVGEILTGIATEFGVRAIFSPADMAKPTSIGRLIDLTLDTFGRLDILVNNAGIQFVSPIDQFPVEKWDQILASTYPRPSTPPGSPCPPCAGTAGAGSSTSPRHMGLSPRPSRPPMWPQSTASLG